MSDRLRKFFRIRGKTSFVLDEVVAPVVLVQDLTQGPYQAGVTPAAGQNLLTPGLAFWSFAILMNDKPGSLAPVLPSQFDGRSFSFTQAEVQNTGVIVTALDDLSLQLVPRSAVIAAGAPSSATNLFSIQNNDGTKTVPVEVFTFPAAFIPGGILWRGILGDNTNTLGSRREFENLKPNITIGPNDALVFASGNATGTGGNILLSVRGFYQEQPA